MPFGPISQQWPEIDGPAGKARVRSLRRIDPLKRNMAAKTSLSHDLDSYAGRFTIGVHVLIRTRFLEADAEGPGTSRRIARDEPGDRQT